MAIDRCFPETDERRRKFKILIRAFGLEVINEVHQRPTFETRRGSFFIDVILISPQIRQVIDTGKVRREWTISDHSPVEIGLWRTPRTANDRRTVNSKFDIWRADWEQFSERKIYPERSIRVKASGPRPEICGRSRKDGWRITRGNIGGMRNIDAEEKIFQKVKSVVDGRTDKNEKEMSQKRKTIQELRIKESKNWCWNDQYLKERISKIPTSVQQEKKGEGE